MLAVPYAAFWLAFAAAYEALFVFTPDIPLGVAVTAGLTIIVPAAVLGTGVIVLASKIPYRQEQALLFAGRHFLYAILYSVAWILVAVIIRNVQLRFAGGSWQFQYPPDFVLRWHLMAGVMIYAAIASTVYAVETVKRAGVERREAELRTLQAQLSPHFLFNTLHTIMALFRSNPTHAETALEHFADLMRYTLEQDRDSSTFATVETEWSFAERYLKLESLRLGDRLRLKTDIADDALPCLIPALSIQPLAENAVIHAVSPNPAGAVVRVTATNQDGRLTLSVEDDGSGGDDYSGQPSHGIGLDAVRARLHAAFGNDAILTVGPLSPAGYRVVIDAPAIVSPVLDLE